MSRDWNILDTGTRSAEENMCLDAELLENLDQHMLPILHFYDWQSESATYGYFVNPFDFLDPQAVARKGLQLAKRASGGGIVFHIWDLAFSVLVPAGHDYFSENTLENYAFVNQAVLAAVASFLEIRAPRLTLIAESAKALDSSCTRFCMAQPTKYDVVFQGKKIAGAAQRKTKKGFLHQGTIALKMPCIPYLQEVLWPNTKVIEAMQVNTFALLKEEEDLQEGRKLLKQHLYQQLLKEYEYVQN